MLTKYEVEEKEIEKDIKEIDISQLKVLPALGESIQDTYIEGFVSPYITATEIRVQDTAIERRRMYEALDGIPF